MGDLCQLRRDIGQGGAVDAAGDLRHQVAAGDAQLVTLTGGVDLRHDGHIGELQLLDELLKEGVGAGVGVGLEGADNALIGQVLHRGEEGVKLTGMVGVVVVDLRAVEAALMLKSAARAGEAAQAAAHSLAGDAQHISGRGGGQGVEDVVMTGHQQLYMGVESAVHHNVKAGEAVVEGDIVCRAAGGGFDAEGEHLPAQIADRVHRTPVIGVGDDVAALGHQGGELAEGVFHILQVLEKVQMVGLHIEDHGHGGEEAVEGVAVLAGFEDDGLALAHPVAGAQQGQRAADHHGGVGLGGHEDVGGHRGGGGFAVGTGDAQGVFILAHDGAPGLGPLVDRDAAGNSPGDLGIFVVDGGGADHQVTVAQVFGAVAHIHMDAKAAQTLHRGALAHVRALDGQAHAPQNLRQRAHGHAADTGQMDAHAGLHVG